MDEFIIQDIQSMSLLLAVPVYHQVSHLKKKSKLLLKAIDPGIFSVSRSLRQERSLSPGKIRMCKKFTF